MSKSNNRKKPEWKDTRLEFSVEYELSMFVRNRCVFFHCLARNVRKMVNYAENFVHGHLICVIYVYGEITLKTDVLKDRKGHILLLIVPDITAADMDTLTKYDRWLERLQKQGFREITETGVLRKGRYKGRVYGNKPNDLWYEHVTPPLPEYAYGIDLMERERSTRERISESVCGELRCRATFPVPDTISGAKDKHNAELTGIIRSLYLYGVEADTNDEYAVKRLAVKKIVSAAYERRESAEIKKLGIELGEEETQMSFWSSVTVGASECVSFLRKYCEDGLRERGCFSLAEAWYLLRQPPYGAYECNWYEYLFALVMREYARFPFFWGDTLLSERCDVRRNIQDKYGFIYVRNEKQAEFHMLLAKMFDIEDPPESINMLLHDARNWITEHVHQATLDCIDHKWLEILSLNEPDGPLRSIIKGFEPSYWYCFGYEEAYLPWLKENFDDHYRRIRRIDDTFRERLAERYGQHKADLYCKYHYTERHSRGWLHSKEMLIEEVERYMALDKVCRECGMVLEDIGGVSYEALKSEDGELKSYLFSYKEVVGLNKKLLNMNCSEYYCIPCLCELTGYDAPSLHHLIHVYQQQGCTLFGG